MPRHQEQVEQLQKMQRRTQSDIERFREELQAEIEPAPASDDDAAADVAADIYERGKIISLIRTLESKLRSIERAIAVAEQGTYGTCEKCGVAIPPERLEIMPETTLCVNCASELERGMSRGHRSSRDQYRRARVLDADTGNSTDSDQESDAAD